MNGNEEMGKQNYKIFGKSLLQRLEIRGKFLERSKGDGMYGE